MSDGKYRSTAAPLVYFIYKHSFIFVVDSHGETWRSCHDLVWFYDSYSPWYVCDLYSHFLLLIFSPWSIKLTIHSLLKITCLIAQKGWWSEIRIQNNQICYICNFVFAMSVHVNCVKLSSESDTWKVNIELKKQHVGKRTSSAASIGYFGETFARVLK